MVECGARQLEVVEAAATVVQENQIVKHASSCRGGGASAWLLVATLVDVVGLAKRIEIGTVAEEVCAVIRHILLQVRHSWIRISDVSGNTTRILVTIGKTCLLSLSAHVRDMVECGARQQEMVEAAATVVQEHQIVKHASSCCGGWASAWFLVASLVDVVGLAKRIEISTVTEEVCAVVRHILFQIRHSWIRISNVSRNAAWIFVAIGKTCFLSLSAHVRDMVECGARQQEMVEAAATVVQEHQIIKHASSCRGGWASAWFLVASLVDVVRLAKRIKVGTITEEVCAVVRHILLQVRHPRIRISDVCGNAAWILVAISEACFLSLSAHV